MMRTKLTVVTNLEVAQVSWADGFCRAAASGGAEISDQILNDGSPQLLLGDEINWGELKSPQTTGYFLAAAVGMAQEKENIRNAHFTTTVSQADKERASRLYGGNPVSVEGFPLNTNELDEFREVTRSFSSANVGFIGRTDADKGPELELLIAASLRKLGANVVHISGSLNTIAESLEMLGVETMHAKTRGEYLARLATLGCVINTSPRESLFVSGLEASRLGIPVIAPDVSESGIADWNFSERMYDPSNVDMAANLAVSLASGKVDVPSVDKYAAATYVGNIARKFEDMQ